MAVNSVFINKLLSYPRSTIVLCNLLDGLDEGCTDAQLASELLDWWLAMVVWRAGISSPSKSNEEFFLLDSLSLLLRENQPPGFRPGQSKPNFILQCRHVVPEPLSGMSPFITVMPSDYFINHLMHEEDKQLLAGTGSLIIDPNQVLTGLMKSGVVTVRLRKGSIGIPSSVLWITNSNIFGFSANRVRDSLGLLDQKTGVSLLVLRLPMSYIDHGRRPTVGDGGNDRFKVRADDVIHRKNVYWGHTTNLDALANGHDILDGVREWVCKPILTSSLGTIEIEPLGMVTKDRGKTSLDNHQAFVDRLSMRHGGKNGIIQKVSRLP